MRFRIAIKKVVQCLFSRGLATHLQRPSFNSQPGYVPKFRTACNSKSGLNNSLLECSPAAKVTRVLFPASSMEMTLVKSLIKTIKQIKSRTLIKKKYMYHSQVKIWLLVHLFSNSNVCHVTARSFRHFPS